MSRISKNAYETFQCIFDPQIDFKDFSEVVKLNRIPEYLSESLPDTLTPGDILHGSILNDDEGIWNFDTDLITLFEDSLVFYYTGMDTSFILIPVITHCSSN